MGLLALAEIAFNHGPFSSDSSDRRASNSEGSVQYYRYPRHRSRERAEFDDLLSNCFNSKYRAITFHQRGTLERESSRLYEIWTKQNLFIYKFARCRMYLMSELIYRSEVLCTSSLYNLLQVAPIVGKHSQYKSHFSGNFLRVNDEWLARSLQSPFNFHMSTRSPFDGGLDHSKGFTTDPLGFAERSILYPFA